MILIFGLLFWLGCYLIVRNSRSWLLWLTGLALLSLAGAAALSLLNPFALTARLARQLIRGTQFLILLSALWGVAAMIALAPGYKMWARRLQTQKRALILAWAGLVSFAVGCSWLVLSDVPVPTLAQLGLMGSAFMLLGTAVAIIIAADQGEAWLPHLFRSFDYSFFTALLFGGQVGLIMVTMGGPTFPLLLLLVGTVATAVLVQVLADPVQTALDQVAFFGAPIMRHRRSDLRAESTAIQLIDDSLDLLRMDEEEFVSYTRRALSHMGDLPKLAANPLTHLPLVQERLGANGRADSTLLRASELKLILTESIERLKPTHDGDFGTTDAWRFYNALYFPYVKGVRPYSRRSFQNANGDEPITREALEWFRTQVPERTLYNWQNAAAQLVARDLRERSRRV
ncbi:MAG: hypothetical protein KJ069_26340 [Anaerolineae bacterium]|nr:hypothetical protein [Anaerolineae bacterium]